MANAHNCFPHGDSRHYWYLLSVVSDRTYKQHPTNYYIKKKVKEWKMTKSHHGAYSEIAMYHYVEMAIVLQICGIVYEMYQSMKGSQKRDAKTVRSPSGAENNHLKQHSLIAFAY